MNNDRKTRLLKLMVVAVLAAESMLFIRWVPDDPFISFRYIGLVRRRVPRSDRVEPVI